MQVHLDGCNAFLNGDVDQELYLMQPPYFSDESQPYAVCKLNKAIYGLRQATRCWYRTVDATFNEMGFLKCDAIQRLYTACVSGYNA